MPGCNDFVHPPNARLKSRKPYIATAKNLCNTGFDHQMAWQESWEDADISSPLLDFERTPTDWTWKVQGVAVQVRYDEDSSCSCVYPQQTMDHILRNCAIRSYGGQLHAISNLDI